MIDEAAIANQLSECLDKNGVIKFADVMTILPFEMLYTFLDAPYPVDEVTLACIKEWTRPPIIESNQVLAAMVEVGLAGTISEARRVVSQGGVLWNGEKVTDPKMSLDFIPGGWGVFKVGKSHRIVLAGVTNEKQ